MDKDNSVQSTWTFTSDCLNQNGNLSQVAWVQASEFLKSPVERSFFFAGGVAALGDNINEKWSLRQPDGGTRHPTDLKARRSFEHQRVLSVRVTTSSNQREMRWKRLLKQFGIPHSSRDHAFNGWGSMCRCSICRKGVPLVLLQLVQQW